MNSLKSMFQYKLTRLENNKKLIIKDLTEVARDNILHAAELADAIEGHIIKTSPERKLPALYVIDSIVKNVGGPYLQQFNESITPIFIHVFEEVNTVEVRQKLYCLRRTWRNYFPESKLYSLDLALNGIDTAWPLVSSVENKVKTLEHLQRHKRELESKLVIVSHYLAQLEGDFSEPALKKIKLQPTVKNDALLGREIKMSRKTDNLSSAPALQEVDVTKSRSTSGSKVQHSAETKREDEDDDDDVIDSIGTFQINDDDPFENVGEFTDGIVNERIYECDTHAPSEKAEAVNSRMVVTVDGDVQLTDNAGTKGYNKIKINVKTQVITESSRKTREIENLEEEYPDKIIYDHPDELSALCTIM